MSSSCIIVPLDFSNIAETLTFVDKLQPSLCRLKIGKELFTKAGPSFVEKLIDRGFDIFLDLKFHDIPTTVARACAVAADLGIWMLNVHASGGTQMMCRAREALENKPNRPLIVAVTILTSMDETVFKQLGFNCTIAEQVMRLAEMSHQAGLDGVVCSAQEASQLRSKLGQQFKLVTPGIRQTHIDQTRANHDDQKRVMTPAQAVAAGSDYLVIGRPVTQAIDPVQVLKDISLEMLNLGD